MTSEHAVLVSARWNGALLAASTSTIRLEGNHYFPPEDVRWEHLRRSTRTTRCFWKGTAVYWDVQAGGAVNPDAAWAYPTPSRAAARIRDHVAFWHGVTVSEEDEPADPQGTSSPTGTSASTEFDAGASGQAQSGS